MSAYRQKGRPYFVYDFKLDGRRFFGSTGERTKRAAAKVERQKRREAELDRARLRTGRYTLDQACGIYWEERGMHTANAGTEEYQLERIISLIGGETLVDDINNVVLAEYVAKARGRKKRNGDLVSNATANRETQLLRRVLRRLQTTRDVSLPNINWKSHMLREPPPRDPSLSEEAREHLIACAAEHIQPAIRFALLTGLRLSNVVHLDWSQVDLQAREMVFVIKGNKHHSLPITEDMLVFLANLGPQETGPVFTYKGRALKTWKTAWKAAKRRAGVTDLRWHDLRHLAASDLVRAGVDISIVQEILAHESIETTRRYVHHDPSAKMQALSKLSRTMSRTRAKATGVTG